MKTNVIRGFVALLSLAALAGCGNSKQLSEAEFDIAIEHIAKSVPIAIDIVTGEIVPTTIGRGTDPVPELKNGNNLKLITSGTLQYEDAVNDVYLYPDYKIAWSYFVSETHGKFELKEETDYMLAIPEYPTYVGGSAVPDSKEVRLYADVTIGKRTERIRIDALLMPQELIEEFSLAEVRSEAASGQVIKVKGYVHGILADWNSAGIADGDWGLGLYRTEVAFKDKFAIGDLVEVVGEYSVYNGLSQVGQIKDITILNGDDYPEIKKPTLTTYTMDDLYEVTEDSWPGSINNKLFASDNSIATFDAPLRFVGVEDRDGKDVGFAGFDTTGKSHTNVILEGTNSSETKFEVTLSINYHMGSANQIAIKEWLQANQNNDIYYRGAISAYMKFVLGPYEFAGHFATTPFTA